ncbi:MAG: hypothetical protein ACRDRK_25170 [Pseudonocardia sp.]
MLKKAGMVVAMATAGLLAVSPLAFATGSVDVVDQENEQESEQGNGILNGNNVLSGNSIQLCDTSVSAVVGVLIPILAVAEQEVDSTEQGRGDCTSTGEAIGQNTEQDSNNENSS